MKYVSYYRVSTKAQERTHLSLDFQRETVLNYIRHNGNELLKEFTETESGKNDLRPQLQKALALCRKEQATLVIAKLDRLSRNVTFISQLMDSQVQFVCCDMPEANELTIHIFAALAQWERKRISERITEALQAKRRREPQWKPGRVNNFTDEGRQKGLQTIRNRARQHSEIRKAYHFIKPLREQGMSYQKIADLLNAESYQTVKGNQFGRMQVMNIWKRFQEQ